MDTANATVACFMLLVTRSITALKSNSMAVLTLKKLQKTECRYPPLLCTNCHNRIVFIGCRIIKEITNHDKASYQMAIETTSATQQTPAKASGLTATVWTIEGLLAATIY
jgi:hypothetical protein